MRATLCAVLVFLYTVLAVGCYFLERWINWKVSYSDQVRTEIHASVKRECLIENTVKDISRF